MNKKQETPIKEILQRDEVMDVLQRDEVAEVLLSKNVSETLHNIKNSIPQNKKDVNTNAMIEKEQASSDKDKDLKALFLITEFQRATIGMLQERIGKIDDLFDRLISIVESLQADVEKITSSQKKSTK